MLWRRSLLVAAGVGLVVSSCFFPSRTDHEDDVEQPSTSTCEEAPVLLVDELDAKGKDHLDSPVAFEGTPTAMLACTQLGCSFDCCDNSCGGGFRLPGLELRSKEFRCGGTDCSSYCTPFSSKPKGRYRFVGTLRGSKAEGWDLDVTSWCRLD